MNRALSFKVSAVLFFLLLVNTFTVHGAVFSLHEIRTDKQYQSASLGVENKFLMVFAGADMFFTSTSLENNLTSLAEYNLPEKIALDASLIIPNGGVRISFGKKPVKPFVKASYFQVLPKITFTSDADDSGITEKMIQDALDIITESITYSGGTAGIGVEYRINEYLGLSGETGTKVSFGTADVTLNADLLYRDSIRADLFYGGPYTSLGVNFYW